MPTASNAKAERFWPAVPEHIWNSIREEFTLPTAADLETHFQSLGDPEAMRRAVRVFLSGLVGLGTPRLRSLWTFAPAPFHARGRGARKFAAVTLSARPQRCVGESESQ